MPIIYANQDNSASTGMDLVKYIKKDGSEGYFWIHLLDIDEDPIDNRISPIFKNKTEARDWYKEYISLRQFQRKEFDHL